MARYLPLPLLAAALSVATAQKVSGLWNLPVRDDARIYNGDPASPGQFPHMAMLYSTYERWWKYCSGSLITTTAVLTAASCVHGYNNFNIRLGTPHVYGDDDNAWSVISIWALVHPDYREEDGYSNLAIIYLPRPVTLSEYIKPVALPSSQAVGSFIGRQALVSGWGKSFPGDEAPSETLHWAEVTVVPNEICKSFFPNTTATITDRTLCAGKETSTVTGSDLGAPLVLKTGKVYTQIGIYYRMTFYEPDPSKPAPYIRVTSFLDWIKLKTGGDEWQYIDPKQHH